jgi:hypothetical protein
MSKSLSGLEQEYRQLAASLAKMSYIVQGSVFQRKKGPGSRYQWTWKNKEQKTESSTLSREEYEWLKTAAKNQHELNRTLKRMRRLTEQIFRRTFSKSKPRK